MVFRVLNGHGRFRLELVAADLLRRSGAGFSEPDREHEVQVLLAALKACCSCRDLESGKRIHSNAAERVCASNAYVGNSLVHMYAKCGSMELARAAFDKMEDRNAVSWNILMSGYVANGKARLALQSFEDMQAEGLGPDSRGIVAALTACTSLAIEEERKKIDGKFMKVSSLEQGRKIHAQARKSGVDWDIFVANSLVVMYAKCGSLVDSRNVFEQMPHHTLVSWNALILGYVENGEPELALELFQQMQQREQFCTPDTRTYVAVIKACADLAAREESEQQVGDKLVKIKSLERGMRIHSQARNNSCDSHIFVENMLMDMYAKCGSMADARLVFEKMQFHDVVSWNVLLMGYVESESELVLELFNRMQAEGCPPNSRTFVAVFKALSSLAVQQNAKKQAWLEQGVSIHAEAVKTGCDSDLFVASTLVGMYAKCGNLAEAQKVFDRMAVRDVVAWNALILGYVENGEAESALEAFARMRVEDYCTPDGLSFVAALTACRSLSALEIGKNIHADICRHGFEEDLLVRNCLVDFYGKCSKMGFAEELFDSMSSRNVVTWSAMIAGYSQLGDTKRVFDFFENMRKQQDLSLQADALTFSSILSACSHAGLVDQGKAYFDTMLQKYGVAPDIDHYHCMLDMLGRANRLQEAVALVKSMPFGPTLVTWTTLLSACRMWKNVEVGRVAFEAILKLDDQHPAAYLLMASIYSSVDA